MRLSIVMIAKDDEAHVGRALSSVVPQLGDECELVCVDDRSSDGTRQLMEESGACVASTADLPSGGVAAARNLGASLASGDYLYHMDSDDELVSGAVERMLTAAEGGADVVRVPHAEKVRDGECVARPVRDKSVEQQAFSPPAPWARMVKRSLYVPFPDCGVRLCLNPAWHLLQSDRFETFASVDGLPCYIWDRTIQGAGTRTVEWSAVNPRTLEQIAFSDELERLGLMKEWPADFLRSVALMMDIGPRLARPHVRAAWRSRLGAELRNLMTGRYVH